MYCEQNIFFSSKVNSSVTGITTGMYTELVPKLTATASVAQLVERWSRDPGSRVKFPARGFGVAFFTTGPRWVLKCISF